MSSAKSRRVTIRYLACGGLHRFTANSPYFEKEESDLKGTERAEFSAALQEYLNVVSCDVLFHDKLTECFETVAQSDLLVAWLTKYADAQKEKVNWRAECVPLLQFLRQLDFSRPAIELFDCDQKLDFLLFIREWFNEGYAYGQAHG